MLSAEVGSGKLNQALALIQRNTNSLILFVGGLARNFSSALRDHERCIFWDSNDRRWPKRGISLPKGTGVVVVTHWGWRQFNEAVGVASIKKAGVIVIDARQNLSPINDVILACLIACERKLTPPVSNIVSAPNRESSGIAAARPESSQVVPGEKEGEGSFEKRQIMPPGLLQQFLDEYGANSHKIEPRTPDYRSELDRLEREARRQSLPTTRRSIEQALYVRRKAMAETSRSGGPEDASDKSSEEEIADDESEATDLGESVDEVDDRVATRLRLRISELEAGIKRLESENNRLKEDCGRLHSEVLSVQAAKRKLLALRSVGEHLASVATEFKEIVDQL